MNWINGRQKDCIYFKIILFIIKNKYFAFDGYILKYQENQQLPKHKDIVENGVHYRLNIGYGNALFECEKNIISLKIWKISVYLFRPDLYFHSLKIIDKTYKISLGYVRF